MDVYKRLRAFYLPYIHLGLISMVCGVFMTAIRLISPLLLQAIIDLVLIEGKHSLLPWLALAAIGAALFGAGDALKTRALDLAMML